MEVGGTVLVTDGFVTESHLTDFLNCKYKLRWFNDLPGWSDNHIITAKNSALSFISMRTSNSSDDYLLRFVSDQSNQSFPSELPLTKYLQTRPAQDWAEFWQLTLPLDTVLSVHQFGPRSLTIFPTGSMRLSSSSGWAGGETFLRMSWTGNVL